jgi:hypothetical protein
MKTKYAHHDLNGVDELRISGWPGEVTVVASDDDSGWVTVEAPERYDGECWTFQGTRHGVLVCFSSLLGSPSLVSQVPGGLPLVVRMPADRIGQVSITSA